VLCGAALANRATGPVLERIKDFKAERATKLATSYMGTRSDYKPSPHTRSLLLCVCTVGCSICSLH